MAVLGNIPLPSTSKTSTTRVVLPLVSTSRAPLLHRRNRTGLVPSTSSRSTSSVIVPSRQTLLAGGLLRPQHSTDRTRKSYGPETTSSDILFHTRPSTSTVVIVKHLTDRRRIYLTSCSTLGAIEYSRHRKRVTDVQRSEQNSFNVRILSS